MTYIPRSSIGNNGMPSPIPKAVKKKRTFKIFGFIGTVVLLLSLLGTGGTFLFKNVSEGQLDSARAALADAASRVGDREARIVELQMYDEQLQTAAELLDNHLALSRLLTALEVSTKEKIQYTAFDYEYDPGFDALLSLDGVSDTFVSVVLQNRQLSSVDSPFEVAKLTDITKAADAEDSQTSSNTDNKVVFNVTGLLQSEGLKYQATTATAPNTSTAPAESEIMEDTEAMESVQVPEDNQPNI